jgi:hypothetical protein
MIRVPVLLTACVRVAWVSAGYEPQERLELKHGFDDQMEQS